MALFEVLFLPFELLDVIETFLSGLDCFRRWRQSESDARIRKAFADPARRQWVFRE